MTREITLNFGSIVCSCVSTQKGTILKAIVVDFLNLLIRKIYRQRLVFCVQPRTQQSRNRANCLQKVTLTYICNMSDDTRTSTTFSLSKSVNTFSPNLAQTVHN